MDLFYSCFYLTNHHLFLVQVKEASEEAEFIKKEYYHLKLMCNACHIEITELLSELKDLSLINKKDGQDYIPRGFYMIDEEEDNGSIKRTYIINTKDLINSKHHSNSSRLNGCCGLDGCDGMNRVCLHDHEIGTEYSDCWTYHKVILDADLVRPI